MRVKRPGARLGHGGEMNLIEAARPAKIRFVSAVQEARRQRARPAMVVRCPGIPEAMTVTVRSRFGPMCSACGAVIDSSPSHRIVDLLVRVRSVA